MPPGDPSGAGTFCQCAAENSLISRARCANAIGDAQYPQIHLHTRQAVSNSRETSNQLEPPLTSDKSMLEKP